MTHHTIGQDVELLRDAVRWVATHRCGDPLDPHFARELHNELRARTADSDPHTKTLWEGSTEASNERWYAPEGKSIVPELIVDAAPGTAYRVVRADTPHDE